MAGIIERIKRLLTPSHAELETIEQTLDTRFPKRVETKVARELEKAYNTPPRIALIGKTGVGKSSTINALFNPRPPFTVGHVRSTTRKVREKHVSLGEDRGSIVIIDSPGLNESIKADQKNIPVIQELLSGCDVALWILRADERALAEDQRLILDLLEPNSHLRERLVVGINQVDMLHPNNWNDQYNLPSPEQEKNIEKKVKDVRQKLRGIGINPQSIVPYSATRGYRLMQLFRTMLDACPIDRAWILSSRKEITPFTAPYSSK